MLPLTELIDDDLRELSEANRGNGRAGPPGPRIRNCPHRRDLHTADSGVRYVLETGSQIPLHAGAAGKAILAYLPGNISDEINLEPFTERTAHRS